MPGISDFMKKIHLISVAAAALLVCSCVPSVNPFFNASDAVFDPRLIGEWQEKDKAEEPQIWQFEQSGDKAYTLSITEKGGKHGKFDESKPSRVSVCPSSPMSARP